MSDIISDMGLSKNELKWHQLAACINMETNWFYDIYESDMHTAKQVDEVCMHCPVNKICYQEGRRNKEYGVWGGVFLHLGQIDRAANSHKEEEVWRKLEKIHGSSLH